MNAPHPTSPEPGFPPRRTPLSTLRSFSLSALLLLLPCLPSAAQTLKFRALSWQGDLANLKYSDGDREVGVEAPEHAPSLLYSKADRSPLELYREVPVEGKPPERRVVASLPLPAPEVTRALLILAPDGPGRYAGRWLDDSPATHPVHTLRVYNLSRRTLAFQTEDGQWTQAPGQTHRVPFDPALRQFPLRIAAQVGDKWEIVASTPQPIRRDYRVHLLLRDARPDSTRPDALVDLLLFYDYVRPAR